MCRKQRQFCFDCCCCCCYLNKIHSTKRAYLCIVEIFLLWFHAKWLNVSLFIASLAWTHTHLHVCMQNSTASVIILFIQFIISCYMHNTHCRHLQLETARAFASLSAHRFLFQKENKGETSTLLTLLNRMFHSMANICNLLVWQKWKNSPKEPMNRIFNPSNWM